MSYLFACIFSFWHTIFFAYYCWHSISSSEGYCPIWYISFVKKKWNISDRTVLPYHCTFVLQQRCLITSFTRLHDHISLTIQNIKLISIKKQISEINGVSVLKGHLTTFSDRTIKLTFMQFIKIVKLPALH